MGRHHPELGFRLNVAAPRPGSRPGWDDDPLVVRPLGPGLSLVVTALTAQGRADPVRRSRCRHWGLAPEAALARAEMATAALVAPPRLWRLGERCWLTLLRAGPFTTGLVIDLARRVPDGGSHGLLVAPDPGTLAVVSCPRPLDRAEADRARELLWGLAGVGPGTIRSLIQFHPAGEFAIFGEGRNRPEQQLP
ncbi:MAG: hypothetical protein OEW29_18785 [Acidimicrobiia bacterium]|nr:hypothetical protein [Acidimicrobiia bacterium]MDH4362776.1 hypothetical protein [Acidimicrobiia bacterium]